MFLNKNSKIENQEGSKGNIFENKNCEIKNQSNKFVFINHQGSIVKNQNTDDDNNSCTFINHKGSNVNGKIIEKTEIIKK